MPLYSFDPAEDGEDWEAELLEEGTDHQQRIKVTIFNIAKFFNKQ